MLNMLFIYFTLGQYLQNQCPAGDDGCLPCPTRLPSCLTLPDGANPFPNPDKSSGYFICDQNRTIAIKTCSVGFFDTTSRQCVQLSTTCRLFICFLVILCCTWFFLFFCVLPGLVLTEINEVGLILQFTYINNLLVFYFNFSYITKKSLSRELHAYIEMIL